MVRPGFPATLREFQLAFADEEACARYLAAWRRPTASGVRGAGMTAPTS